MHEGQDFTIPPQLFTIVVQIPVLYNALLLQRWFSWWDFLIGVLATIFALLTLWFLLVAMKLFSAVQELFPMSISTKIKTPKKLAEPIKVFQRVIIIL